MSVNSKMTAIADAIRAKTGGTGLLTLDDMAQDIAAIDTSENLDDVLDEQESIIDQLQAALEGKAFPKGVSLDVITAASLPATVVDNQIVVITDTTPGTIYVDTDEPANAVNGDVWVQVGSSDYGVELSETFRNGFNKAKQYDGNAWSARYGYIGTNGEWKQFARLFPEIGTPLSEWEWGQIIALVNSGEDVTTYFAVGDEKELTLTTGETVTVVIGDFHHNTITETGITAAIAFTFKNCLNTTYAMNTAGTNSGGWGNSNMRNTHIANILATFPAELQADGAIKTVDVVATAGNQSTTLATTSDRLRLHTLTELGITSSNSGTEGTVYAYYVSGNRTKTVDGAESPYWTRSPYVSNATNFCTVSGTGTASRSIANNANGIAIAFDI